MTTQVEEQATNLVGTRMKRVEDPSMITGAAKYLDDLKLPGMAYVAVLRSPYAHARINSIDTAQALAKRNGLPAGLRSHTYQYRHAQDIQTRDIRHLAYAGSCGQLPGI